MANKNHHVFMAIYTIVMAGIAFYILSIVYMRRHIILSVVRPTSSTVVNSTHMGHASNLSRPAMVDNASSQPHQVIWTRPIWDGPPVGTKMPNSEAFRLTKEMVKHRAKDNVIIVTSGNHAFMDFTLNWVKHLTDLGLFNILVGALDTKLLEALYWKGVPVFDIGSNMTTADVSWASYEFIEMGREKVSLITVFLSFGYEILMCDADMVWLKNPLPYFAHFPKADILISSDQLIPTVTDDSLEKWEEVKRDLNVGIFYWRPTESAKRFVKEWKDMIETYYGLSDQMSFNPLMRKILGPSIDEESGLFYAFDGRLKLGILPASIFCSGHTYFVQAMYEQLRLQPYAAHTTFQHAGTDGKRHRLREARLFHDPPEYYDFPGGFLSFKPCIPKSLLLDGEHTIESHFSLINYQVMPPLWCRFDRLWSPHPGVLPGTLTRQPFLCPLDHVFELKFMLSEHPEEDFGPVINFREYSFLDNPSLPKQVKESWMEIQLCDEGSADCHVSNKTSQPWILRFPKHSNEEMFTTVFSAYKDVKILQFSSMEDAFQGFTDKVREAKFRKRVKRYVGMWCCLKRHIGHIYYDMYWDEKPGWKPSPPNTAADDHPPW